MTARINEPGEIRLTAANGKTCGLRERCVEFEGYDVTLSFFAASPELVELLTGNDGYFDAQGNVKGWWDTTIRCRGGIAIEAWADMSEDVACPDDEDEGEGVWFYFLLPWLTNGRLGDLTLGDDGVTFTYTGRTKRASRWGVGPWNDVDRDENGDPGPLLQPVPEDAHRGGFPTTVAPPEAECTYLDVPCESPESPES
ncbi:hypothetical protein [Phytoactinopolyspora mesophila]|uniref:Uncharacterized protein n=1 Tax=Phytoactinopolyspora mesophila TaxID=2650750 RepID=A0A7K3M8A2_9ACTN|nr:hypothetical protein [Phytoactinopolyspora mesophila]NDL58638.1 hypothetical protein [Phytoactinopolyspora mesophila]